MKLLRVLILLATTAAPVSFAHAQTTNTPAPIWTDVMNATSCITAACGNYFPLGSNNYMYQTDLAQIPNSTVALTNLALPTSTHYTWNCGGTNSGNGTPLSNTTLTFLETYQGSGITGVGFQGTFTNTNLFTLTVQDPMTQQQQVTNLFEAVFFNENQCYTTNGVGNGDEFGANGREYGFFLASSSRTIYAYWGALENQGSNTVQVNFPLTTSGPGFPYGTNMQTAGNGAASPVPGLEYYYEIYPVQITGASWPANCGFQINVFNNNNTVTPIYTALVPVNGGPNAGVPAYGIGATPSSITGADSSFCNFVAASGGDTGFVSANVVPSANTISVNFLSGGASNMLPSSADLNVYLQRLFVGKE